MLVGVVGVVRKIVEERRRLVVEEAIKLGVVGAVEETFGELALTKTDSVETIISALSADLLRATEAGLAG